MDRFRVVICGGGIAAVEGLLRLRRPAGDALEITLVAPGDELRYRPLAVQEPFARPGARRQGLRRIVERAKAGWVQGAVEWVDSEGQVVHTAHGQSLPYDALLLAVGAHTRVPYEHVTVFDDAHPDDTQHGLVQDVEQGYTGSVALLLPEGPAGPLPVYELALMTAERAHSMGLDDVRVELVTAVPSPLAAFGGEVSRAVSELLEGFGVRVHAGSTADVPAPASAACPRRRMASYRSTTAAGCLDWAPACSRRATRQPTRSSTAGWARRRPTSRPPGSMRLPRPPTSPRRCGR